MTEEIKNQEPTTDPGAASSPEPSTPPTPKVEIKDGATFVEVDGKMVKMVRESDLIAAKQSLESKLESQQAAHSQAIDNAQLELSAERQKVADLNAKLKEAQEASGQGAMTDEEVARIKQERDNAVKSVETLTAQAGKALELRKALLVAKYPGVTAEHLADKTMEQLDSFEEALKAVSQVKGGIGPYAVGGGLGQAQPMSDEERRRQALASATVGFFNARPEEK